MNHSVTKVGDDTAPARPAHERLAPLSAINARDAAAQRAAGRVTDVPGRRGKPITFDSAL
ncbi:hypothetical protein DY218_21105 [Streptomyces triticagri]|uniref:FXSXX-COOH protein n=1 Tax=Streptomyces triticagri TaxID=2293568 RepID=A0A372M183_9ACTN|nr:hypothetical protein [Streptomyces triticagri]RFU84696.1 hypothetical protein DY218_21105 [Streptomyces triticagri]